MCSSLISDWQSQVMLKPFYKIRLVHNFNNFVTETRQFHKFLYFKKVFEVIDDRSFNGFAFTSDHVKKLPVSSYFRRTKSSSSISDWNNFSESFAKILRTLKNRLSPFYFTLMLKMTVYL